LIIVHVSEVRFVVSIDNKRATSDLHSYSRLADEVPFYSVFFSLIGPPINCDVNDKIENIWGQTVPKPKIQSTAKAYAIKASSV